MSTQLQKFRRTGEWVGATGLFFAAVICRVDAAEINREVMAMGTRLVVSITADDTGDSWLAGEAAIRAVDEVESRLSTWREGSDVSRIDRADAGRWVEVSPRTVEDLSVALAWSETTQGAFHPGIGAMVRAWLGRDLENPPDPAEIEEFLAAVNPENLEIQEGRVRRLHRLYSLDAGAFGKGVALKKAADVALARGATCIDLNFGGQVMRAGQCEEVIVAIADPQDRWSGVMAFRMATGSLATSGNSERGKEGVPHIIDPRNGRPSPFGGSVTVMADDPVVADCLSTALFVMGPEKGKKWLKSHTGFGVEAVWISADGRILSTTPRFGRIWEKKSEKDEGWGTLCE